MSNLYLKVGIGGFFFFSFLFFLEQGLYVALAVVELTCFVDLAGLELTEVHLPLPPESWSYIKHFRYFI